MSSIEDQNNVNAENKWFKIKGAIFLTSVAGFSALIGFSRTLATVKRDEQNMIANKPSSATLMEEGTTLALRALGRGSIYACLRTSMICYGIWKLSGARNLIEFRQKMGEILPKLSSNDPPLVLII